MNLQAPGLHPAVVFIAIVSFPASTANFLGDITCDAGIPKSYTGTTAGGSSNHNENGRGGNDAVWTLTLGQPMTVTLNQCAQGAANFPNPVVPGSANTWDSVLQLYDTCLKDGCIGDGSCNTYPMGTTPASNSHADNQNNCGGSTQEYRRVTLPQGKYVIVLDSMNAATVGEYVLNVSCAPPNATLGETPKAYHTCVNCFGVVIPTVGNPSRGDCPPLGNLANGAKCAPTCPTGTFAQGVRQKAECHTGVITQSDLQCIADAPPVGSTETKCCSDVFWLFVGIFIFTALVAGVFGLAFYFHVKEKAKDVAGKVIPGMNRDVDIFDDQEDSEQGADEASGVLVLER